MSFLHRLSHALISHFWLIWAIGLVAAPLLPLWMFRKRLSEPVRRSLPVREPNAKLPKGALVAFVVFTVLYLGFMFWGEDFCYQDGHAFTDYTAIGLTRPPAIWHAAGRFWPLGYQEYNLIAHLSATATAFLMFGAVQLVLALWLLYSSMPHLRPAVRLFVFFVLMLAPAFGADFAELTYADRNVVFAICLLIFCVRRYDAQPTISLLLTIIVLSYFALFYKETTPALLGTFAGSRILIKLSRGGFRTAFKSPLEIGIISACAYFAVLLGLTLLPTGTSDYIKEGSVGRPLAALRYLTGDPLLAAFLVAFGIHVARTVRQGKRFDPLWDCLGFGAVLHIAAVASTGLAQVYLMGPSELVATLTLARLASAWWDERSSARPILTAAGVALVAVSLTFGAFRLIERKNIVWQWEKISDFVVAYYRGPDARQTRLYLAAEGGVAMNFLSFLRYKGLQFHSVGEPAGTEAIAVAGSEDFPEDRCVTYEPFICHQDAVHAGDLIVRLPEESWMPNETGLRRGDEVFRLHDMKLAPLYSALPGLFSSPFRPLLAALYRVSPTLNGIFRHRALPDDWLSVSASKVVPSLVATRAADSN